MSNDIQVQVTLLKTIADETRLRILGLLAGQAHSGRELADALGLTAATVSHHMKRLSQVGIVEVTQDGTRHLYRLNAALLRDLARAPEPPAVPEAPAARAEADSSEARFQARTVRNFFDGRRLTQIPAKRKARAAVLLELLTWFEAGRDYTEAEVNEILREAHEDVAYLRRELVDYRYLTRADGIYQVATEAPVRDRNEAQEVPGVEREWLGALIASSIGSTAPRE